MLDSILKMLIRAAIEAFPIDPERKQTLRRRILEGTKQ